MVFEHLFPESFVAKKSWMAFVLAVIISTLSIGIARVLFPANSGIVSIVFVSILLLPYFEGVLKREERQERKPKPWSFHRLFVENHESVRIYLMLFAGIYITYMLYAFAAHSFGMDVGSVFREQLSVESIRGGAIFDGSRLFTILINNWWVLLACFLVALIAGDGAVFFIAWNASTWGTVFGYRAVEASLHGGGNSLWLLFVIFVITLPHVLLEGGSYILAAVAGSVLSAEIVEKTEQIKEFVLYLVVGGLLYGALVLALHTMFGEYGVFFGVGAVILALGVLYSMHFIFSSDRDRVVFKYNFYLFLIAMLTFIFAALIETLVLANATPLREIYFAAGH